ncbi:MAG: phenylacetate--CoA ligase family protein [Clostridiales bacterium]|nr:phenylacetate--CoA ligase family protein [Clostridiales bacterium]
MTIKTNLFLQLMGLAAQGKRIFNGTIGQSKFTKYIESIQYLPKEELNHLQNIELSKILNHAVNNIPYYKNLLGELELSPESVGEDIKQFPIITKEIYSKQKDKFIDPKLPVIKSMFSGGTTMTRVSVNTGKYFESHKSCEYFNRVAGIYPGMTKFILSRHESTYVEGGPKELDINYSTDKLSRTYLVSPYNFNAEKLKKAYKMFIKVKPQILKGNSTMLFEFAMSIEKNGWKSLDVPIALCSQSNMQSEYIEALNRVFKAKVFNAYGATESGLVAVQCEKGEGLHYIPILHYLETLKDGKQVLSGETGELIITSLAHYAMPIIRYQIGDYATLTDTNCSCGRTFPLIEKIDGRISEMINSSIGTVATVYDIRLITNKIPDIMDYQVVQTSPGSLEIRLKCKNEGLEESEIDSIRSGFKKLLECDMDIKIEYVTEIERLPSGKILRVISIERYQKAKAAGMKAGSV